MATSPMDVEETGTDRARGLARLLLYGLLDAKELGSRRTAATLQSAIDQLKAEYGLTDREILRF